MADVNKTIEVHVNVDENGVETFTLPNGRKAVNDPRRGIALAYGYITRPGPWILTSGFRDVSTGRIQVAPWFCIYGMN